MTTSASLSHFWCHSTVLEEFTNCGLCKKWIFVTGQPRRAKDGLPLPSARVISTTMQDSIRQTSRRLSQMLPFWGQFIDHDLTNTPTTSRECIW